MRGGGGWAGEVPKKYSQKGKLNEKKNSSTPINPTKYSCYGLKRIHSRNLITEKNFCGTKIPHPPPPHKFSNGPSLTPRENCYRVFVCFDVVVVVTVVFDITQITECQR